MKANETTEFVIGRGSVIEGTVSSPGIILVEGRCKGFLRSPSEIIIAQNAEMEGDLDAGSVVVAGSIRGNIQSRGLVSLTSQAKVKGDISTPLFRMEEGAFFEGKVIRTVG